MLLRPGRSASVIKTLDAVSLRKNVDPTIFTNFIRQTVQGVIVVQIECEVSCTLGILHSPLFYQNH